jgi:hypothetical protein
MLWTLPTQRCKKNALDLKKAFAEHYVPVTGCYVCWFLSRAHSRMEQIADILDTTSDKLQEALDSPSSDVEDTMYDWDWLQQHGIDMQQP